MKAISTTKMRVFTDEEINEVNSMQVVTNKEVNEISGGVSSTYLDYLLWKWPWPWMHPIAAVASSTQGTSRPY